MPNLNSYGNAVISVITAFSGLFGQLEALLRFPAFLSAVITGIALLQNRPKTKTAAIICGIFNTLAALSFASMLLLCTQPQWILSLFFSEGSSPEYLAVLDQFFILDDIRGAIYFFTAVTAILAGISFGSLFTLRNNYTGTPLRPDRSLSGLFILLPFLVIYRLLSILLPTILTGTVMGSSALAALSFANSVSAYHFTALFTWLFLLVLVLSVIFRKPPFSWTALAVGGVLLLCIAGLCLPIPDFRVYNVPESIIEMVNSYYQVKLLGSALLLIAFSLWCVAITRNTIPLWLQWVLPCVIIPLYLLAEVFTCVIAQLSSPGMGQIICAIPILIVTITVGFLRAGRKYK